MVSSIKNIRLTETQTRWIGIFLLGFVVMATDVKKSHGEDFGFWTEYLISTSFCMIYWNGATFIFLRFRKVFPRIDDTGKRLVLTYLSLFVWMSIGGLPLKMILGLVEYSFIGMFTACSEYFVMNIALALIIGTGYETTYFFVKWKESIRQNEELKNQQIRTQFEVLQNQMSPHFLFNSLNTLTTLIAENQNTAIDFTQRLSEVYRYILQNKERELVYLNEELDFAKSYVYLLQMRYPENLIVAFDVDAQYEYMSIAPLTLQMLIENAIKHNVVSKARPLDIRVFIENAQTVAVENNLQKKMAIEKSTKTGLENIQKRYEFLGDRNIEILENESVFRVSVPLIRLVDEQVKAS